MLIGILIKMSKIVKKEDMDIKRERGIENVY